MWVLENQLQIKDKARSLFKANNGLAKPLFFFEEKIICFFFFFTKNNDFAITKILKFTTYL